MNKYIYQTGPNHPIALAEATALNLELSHFSRDFFTSDKAIDTDKTGSLIKSFEILETVEQLTNETISNVLNDIFIENKVTIGFNFLDLTRPEKESLTNPGRIKKLIDANSVRFYYPFRGSGIPAPITTKFQAKNNGYIELLLVKDEVNKVYYIAKLLTVNSIEKFVNADYNKKYRDLNTGMLPPKLALTIINLASYREKNDIYDPFCGTGTINLMANFLGIKSVGSDIEKKLTDKSTDNSYKYSKDMGIDDLTTFRTKDAKKIDDMVLSHNIASEGYLGMNFSKDKINNADIRKTYEDITNIYLTFFDQLSKLEHDKTVVICFPFWNISRKEVNYTQEFIDKLTKIGYNLAVKFSATELKYIRDNQSVGRQILILEKE